jgi:predicted TIM-barrel fold metal-dependent hydrolase
VTCDPATGNRALARFLDTAPDRLLGYVTVHLRRLQQAERDLRSLLPTRRFVSAKIHTDYTGSPIRSPQMRDALTMLAELDCPALVHTWEESVLDLAQQCLDIPGLRVIAGHMGAGGYRHAKTAARSCDRLYLEPSWSHGLAGRVDEVLDAVDARQLLFGTDATLIDPASTFGVLAAARPEPAVAERIAWRNAADLFRIQL